MYFILRFSVHVIGAGFPRGWMGDKGWIQTETPELFPKGCPCSQPWLQSRAGTQLRRGQLRAWSLHPGNEAAGTTLHCSGFKERTLELILFPPITGRDAFPKAKLFKSCPAWPWTLPGMGSLRQPHFHSLLSAGVPCSP